MNLPLLHRFKTKLTETGVVGPFCKSTDPAMIEVLGLAGMDFVILDLEHGPNDNNDLGGLIRAAEAGGALPVVRVGSAAQIGRALDQGALGVQVPHIGSAGAAKAAVEAARFAPLGARGVCRYVRAAAYGIRDKFAYFREANEALLILQVEGKEGLEHLPEILDVPGIDLIFVGVYDLSQSIGLTGQVNHPDVKAGLQEVVERCRERGIPVGTFVENVDTAKAYREMGVRYFGHGVDVGLLADAAGNIVRGYGLAG